MPSTPDSSSDDLHIDNRTGLDETSCLTGEEILKYGFGGKPACDNNYFNRQKKNTSS